MLTLHHILGYILIIVAVIIITLNNEINLTNIPDITIKYNMIFFILSLLYAIRWIATDNLQRGVFYIIFSIINLYIGYLHIIEHYNINN